MQQIKNHKIPLDGTNPTDLNALKDIIESNSYMFEEYLLTDFGGDARYSVVDGSFEITAIAEGFFEYTAEINFYAGCADMNDTSSVNGTMEFEIEDGNIIFELDETVWNVR
ncbi:TPA: hypothetical protein U2Q59_000818 [Enterobacter hormaechei]|nr:hypothetical protein [Enterobacter hormaechei]